MTYGPFDIIVSESSLTDTAGCISMSIKPLLTFVAHDGIRTANDMAVITRMYSRQGLINEDHTVGLEWGYADSATDCGLNSAFDRFFAKVTPSL